MVAYFKEGDKSTECMGGLFRMDYQYLDGKSKRGTELLYKLDFEGFSFIFEKKQV